MNATNSCFQNLSDQLNDLLEFISYKSETKTIPNDFFTCVNLLSSTTSGGSYSLTDNYDTQTTFGSNVPGQYTFEYNVAYGVQAGKYYKIYSVQTTSDGSKLPSYLSTWSATPFLYNPKILRFV